MIAQAEAIDTLEVDLESLAVEIEAIHSAINLEAVFEIGERVAAANDVLANNKNGRFLSWVTDRLSYTPRTAQNYMKAFRRFGETEYRESLSQYATAEAVYALVKQPDEIIDELVDDAEATGERITLAKVKELAPPAQPDEPLAISDALLKLTRTLHGVMKWFPKEHLDALARRLISAGDEILVKGDLA